MIRACIKIRIERNCHICFTGGRQLCCLLEGWAAVAPRSCSQKKNIKKTATHRICTNWLNRILSIKSVDGDFRDWKSGKCIHPFPDPPKKLFYHSNKARKQWSHCFCWFGALWFGFLVSPYERDCYLGVPPESQTTNSNHQLTTSWVLVLWMVNQPPRTYSSPRNEALIRAYEPLVSFNRVLIKPVVEID